jgi:hypothetical protein
MEYAIEVLSGSVKRMNKLKGWVLKQNPDVPVNDIEDKIKQLESAIKKLKGE